jgi:multiple antibiotic resistance protein
VSWRVIGETFVTLLVIMDPAGTAPIFVGLTSRMSAGERQRAALRAVLAAGLLIIGFALFGEVVLEYLGVSVESLSIAGGLLLLLVALEMLRGIDARRARMATWRWCRSPRRWSPGRARSPP